jgi:hypothetical protein
MHLGKLPRLRAHTTGVGQRKTKKKRIHKMSNDDSRKAIMIILACHRLDQDHMKIVSTVEQFAPVEKEFHC